MYRFFGQAEGRRSFARPFRLRAKRGVGSYTSSNMSSNTSHQRMPAMERCFQQYCRLGFEAKRPGCAEMSPGGRGWRESRPSVTGACGLVLSLDAADGGRALIA